jgi:hypothetical protein
MGAMADSKSTPHFLGFPEVICLLIFNFTNVSEIFMG